MIGTWALVSLQNLAAILSVALIWVGAYRLNAVMFSPLEYSHLAHWIFLPAALRIISVLLLGFTGALGLILGAYLTLASDNLTVHHIILALSSGIAPMAAIWFCRRLFPISKDLSGLRAWHVVLLSLANAAANSLILNGYLASADRLNGEFLQLMAVFIGDVLGTALVLLLLSTLITALIPPRAQ